MNMHNEDMEEACELDSCEVCVDPTTLYAEEFEVGPLECMAAPLDLYYLLAQAWPY